MEFAALAGPPRIEGAEVANDDECRWRPLMPPQRQKASCQIGWSSVCALQLPLYVEPFFDNNLICPRRHSEAIFLDVFLNGGIRGKIL